METPRKRALIGNNLSPSQKKTRKELKLQLKVEMIKEYESGTFKQTELASKYGIGKKYGVRYSETKRRVEKEWESNGNKSMFTHFVMLICTVKCCALCITESDLFLVPKKRGFLKTELLWKPNFRDGPEAVRFSQIILYCKYILLISV